MGDIKVYRTNVPDQGSAKFLSSEIIKEFPEYTPLFDLDDCDNVLKVISRSTPIRESELMDILLNLGYSIEILP